MQLETLKIEVKPKRLAFTQLVIEAKQPIILNKNKENVYEWCGNLPSIEFKKETQIALIKGTKIRWQGTLGDLKIIARDVNSFTFDFNGVFKSKEKKEEVKVEEIKEEIKEEVVEEQSKKPSEVIVNGIPLKLKI